MTPPVQPPQPLALYGPDFAADPQSHYRSLRGHGPLAPVRLAPGVDALLVTDYQAAVDLLRDTHTFTKDPRAWQATVPDDSPVLPMLGYRPTALFSDGDVHARYRDAINDGLALIEPHVLRAEVARVAQRLIGEFAVTGSGDLIAQYARRLPVHVFVTWFGVPPGDSERIVNGIAGMFNSAEDAATAYTDLVEVVTELVADRRARPRRDLTSYLLAHPADLDNDETVRQITLIMSAGHDPTTNLIGNALLHMLTDARYAGSLHGGAMTAHEAIDEVLWQDPPLANLSAHYPRHDTEFHGVRLRAGQLLLVSYAAANTQSPPGLSDPGIRSGGSAHLAWSAGPHRCPAKQPALLIAMTAIEQLTSQLCDAELDIPISGLRWRQGPFHRALVRLPVRFTPVGMTAEADRREAAGSASGGPSAVSISP
ncbi:cytochrome P450 [Streptomyces sp. NBC_01221]|uniref:cytochrome P450 n=1 Tax=unclassified Streptomyces TaxID=2593676 RepID=UPI00225B0330|nr:cytochrome P450 [Streptomyces sp. NBC_01221]MCX4789975.1 cytochrome P450 [Streptomyces sp. NBC_01221]WSP58228.1 cytochrome P450 [Streptomyces sp. NBC_01241]WSU21194.1 cytochrome P450 [Streptomyces sp. NBC_01108]